MPTCKELATAASNGEAERAGFGRRISTWFHLLICKTCRAYVRQIGRIGEGSRELFGDDSGNAEALERLERRLVGICSEAEPSAPSGDSESS